MSSRSICPQVYVSRRFRNAQPKRRQHLKVESSLILCQKSGKFETEGSRLKPIPPPRRPFQMWGMDLTMLPKSDEGPNYLFVAVDYLSKYVEAAPLKIKEAPAILTFFDNI
ncbi:hypothetical protein ACOMHN_054871 [Nucella lapillus]